VRLILVLHGAAVASLPGSCRRLPRQALADSGYPAFSCRCVGEDRPHAAGRSVRNAEHRPAAVRAGDPDGGACLARPRRSL